MNAAQIQQVLRQAGWPENLIVTMGAVALAESGGDPNALNARGEYSVGLLQVNRRAHPQYPEHLLRQPLYNAQAALEIYRKQGIRAWGAYTDGRYRRYLSQSQAAYGSQPTQPAPQQLPMQTVAGAQSQSDPFLLPFTDDPFATNYGPAEQSIVGGSMGVLVGVVAVVLVVSWLISD